MDDHLNMDEDGVASAPLSQQQRRALDHQLVSPPPSLLPGVSSAARLQLIADENARQELQLIAADPTSPDICLRSVEEVLGMPDMNATPAQVMNAELTATHDHTAPMVKDHALGARTIANRSPDRTPSSPASSQHLPKRSKPLNPPPTTCPQPTCDHFMEHHAESQPLALDPNPTLHAQHTSDGLLDVSHGTMVAALADVARHEVHTIAQLYQVFSEKFESLSQQISAVQSSLKTDFSTGFADVNKQLTSIHQDISDLQKTQTVTNQNVTGLTSRVASVEQDVSDLRERLTSAEQSLNNAAQAPPTASNTKDMAYMKRAMAEQLSAALQPQIDPHKLKLRLLPTSDTPAAHAEFGTEIGSLTPAQLAHKLDLPQGTQCHIRSMLAPRLQPRDPPQRCAPGAPCREIVVEFEDETARNLAKSYQTKGRMKANHSTIVHDYLIPVEVKNKQHLQRTVVPMLRDELNLQTGWRRGQLTWKVESKNNWAVLSACEIPANPTREQLCAAIAVAEECTMARLPPPPPNPPPACATNMNAQPSSS